MKQFTLGFVVASVLWLGFMYAESSGFVTVFGCGQVDEVTELAVEPDRIEEKKSTGKNKKRGLKKKSTKRTSTAAKKGDGVSGDDLEEASARNLDLGRMGSEQQLSPEQIEAGIDKVFGGIKRCLVLVSSEASAVGTVDIGMNISADGRVTKVSLKGPNALIAGEAGVCFRRVVKSIDYPSFDGPDIIVHYPITFE